MWPQAVSVPSVKCLKTYCVCTVCAVNPVCPADPVCRAALPTAAGSYITVLITATSITCGELTDTHSFSPTFPQSVTISSALLTLVSSPPILSYFHLMQLNALFNALFPTVSFHYPLLLPLSPSLYLCHFGCIPKFPAITHPLCVSTSFLTFSLSSLSVTSICPHHLSLSFSPPLSLSLCLGSNSNITNAIAYWLGAKSARR